MKEFLLRRISIRSNCTNIAVVSIMDGITESARITIPAASRDLKGELLEAGVMLRLDYPLCVNNPQVTSNADIIDWNLDENGAMEINIK